MYRVRKRGKGGSIVLRSDFKSALDAYEFITIVGKDRQSFAVDVKNDNKWEVFSVLCAKEAKRRLGIG